MNDKNKHSGNISRSRFWLPLGSLAGLLLLSELVYLALLKLNAVNGWRPVSIFWLEMGGLFVLYALAAIVVWRFRSIGKPGLWLIIFGAVLFRVTLLPAGIPYEISTSEKLDAMKADLLGSEVAYERFQLFDNDIWRYVWDGHVSAHGVNPYQFAPDDPRVDFLTGDAGGGETGDTDDPNTVESIEKSSPSAAVSDPTDGLDIWTDVRDNVNYAGVTTIYPPLAQGLFWLSHEIAPGSVLMMKLLLVGCELIGILFLGLTLRRLEMPVTSVILYAWNPLMIKVFAASGHADAILVATLCMLAYFIARGAKTFAAVALGLAILAKLSPVILLPFVARRIGLLRTLLIAAVVFIGYLPFLDAGQNLFAGFLKFAGEWQFNPGVFGLLRWIFEFVSADAAGLARTVCALMILAIVGWLTMRDDLSERNFFRASAIVLGSAIILSPTVMPWYLSWVLPFAVLARQYIWIFFSAFVLMAFHIMIDLNEYTLVLWFEHGLFFALLFFGLYRRKITKPLSLVIAGGIRPN
ncbi:MAG: hypothetical protein ACRD6X_14800 [Pyrinomonadaceae bacterium]